MKKLIVALSTIFCAVIVAVSIYSCFPKEPQTSPQQNTAVHYTVRDYAGKVAVFESGSSKPLVVYEIYTHLLPENDIELLRRGIEFDNMQQLQACLEDLGL